METRNLIKIIILVLLCLAVHAFTVQAQVLYSKDSKITVTPNTLLTIKGGVDNSGVITNNGHLKVAGPWVNSGMYEAGTGEITFDGTSVTVPQIIHHNGQSFSRMTLAGGTKKTILSDLTVEKAIHFDNGVVEAAGASRIIFDADVRISGPSDRSHIHGVVYHKGAGDKLFPIGNGLQYLPVELLDVRDVDAVVGIQGLEFGNVSLGKPATLQSISDKGYWRIDVASGGLDQAQVVLPLRDEWWLADAANLVVAQSSALTDRFTSIGRSFLEGDKSNGRVASAQRITMPFVALAATAEENNVVVYNAVSVNGDDLNAFVRIKNIENFPVNKFSVYNRWGDKVFEIRNYDNGENVFRGVSNLNGQEELSTGNYFYVLELPEAEPLRGFISLKN
jgi:gliding motility-associated-like protein